MLFAEKEFSYYWTYFQLPFFVLLAWTVFGAILAFINFSSYQSIFTPLISWIVQILLFAAAGYFLYEDAKEPTVGQSAWSGALMGVIVSFFSAALAIVMMFTLPAMLDLVIAQSAAQGITLSQAQLDIVKYMSFTGLITGPIVGGVIGGACGAVGGLIAKLVSGKK